MKQLSSFVIQKQAKALSPFRVGHKTHDKAIYSYSVTFSIQTDKCTFLPPWRHKYLHSIYCKKSTSSRKEKKKAISLMTKAHNMHKQDCIQAHLCYMLPQEACRKNLHNHTQKSADACTGEKKTTNKNHTLVHKRIH